MNTYRVLVADDERSIRRILEKICRGLEWTVDTAEDGNAALELMERNDYQIFTVDVNMPGPSGVELSRKILERYDSPAIIILTGYAEVKQAVEATKEGVYNYIQKDDMNIGDIKEQLIQAANYHHNLLLCNQARKQRESEIKDVETASRQFQAVFDSSTDIILIADVETMQITDCNPAACDRFEFLRADLRGMMVTDFVAELSKETVQQQINTSNENRVAESVVQSKNGNSIPVEIKYTHVCLPHGEYISVMMRDISERKEMEAQILHERNLLHLLMDNIPDSIFFKDHDLKYTCINKAYASRLNLSSPKQALHKTDVDLLSKANAAQNQNEETDILNSKQPLINQVNEFLFPDGSKKWYTSTKVPILNPDQTVQGLVGISRDISSIKNAEQKILKTTNDLEGKVIELDSIMEGLPLGVMLTNELLHITQVNLWVEKCLNVPKEYLIGTPVQSTFKEYLNVNLEDQIQPLIQDQEQETIEHQITHHDSTYNISMKKITNEDTFMGLIVFIQSVPESSPAEIGVLQDDHFQEPGYEDSTLESIKTPVNGIIEMAKQLKSSHLNNEQQMLVETILNCSESSLTIIESKTSIT